MTILLYLLVITSTIGLLLSVLVNIGSLIEWNMPEAVFGLHFLLLVVWIPSLIVYAPREIRVPENVFEAFKVPFRGAPRWMRYMLCGFLAYAVLNGIFFPTNNQSGTPPSVIRFFSSAWMAGFSFSLAVLYSKTQTQKKDVVRKCPNGHKVPFPSTYCQKCGEPISDLENDR